VPNTSLPRIVLLTITCYLFDANTVSFCKSDPQNIELLVLSLRLLVELKPGLLCVVCTASRRVE
jgi:hypothetical protein